VANVNSNNVSILLGAAGATFTGPVNFAVGTEPRAIAVGEFNGDWDPDLAVLNATYNTVSILGGAAGGSFTGRRDYIAGGSDLAVGDFDGDSDDDLVFSSGSILLNMTPVGYPRPLAASPIQVSLVPAFAECTGASNRTHGPPLAYPSCAPP